jgi:hypothetical protein
MKITLLRVFSVACMLLVGSLLLTDSGVDAQTSTITVNLSWNANTESDLAGYRVYRGQGTTQCGATTPLSALVVGTTQVAVLKPATTYADTTVARIDGPVCYELTAYDTVGNVSGRSNRAQVVLNLNPPSAPQNLNIAIP